MCSGDGPHGGGGSDFDAGRIHEPLCTAKGPSIFGLGFAATRGSTDRLRHSGHASNVLAGGVNTVAMHGTPRGGRWPRAFLGFDEGEGHHRRVADGPNPRIGPVSGENPPAVA